MKKKKTYRRWITETLLAALVLEFMFGGLWIIFTSVTKISPNDIIFNTLLFIERFNSKSSELLTRYSSSEANHRVEKFPMKLSTGSSNNFVSGRLNSYF